MIDKKFREVAISVISDYMGVAAEFVVDDAIAATLADKSFSARPDLQHILFFSCLGKQLPPDAPYLAMKAKIAKALGLKV